jgi:hypothetical protein
MSLLPSIFLTDSSGRDWFLSTNNNATPIQVPVLSQPSAVPFLYLNSVTDGTSFQISIVGNPAPIGKATGDIQTMQVATNPSYPTQLLVTAPNGTIYAIQVATVIPPTVGVLAQGTIQVALPNDLSSVNCNTPISTLAQNVLERLEDPTGIFWSENFEIYSGLVEAMNDLLLLVGRPTQMVGMQFNLIPNTPWQTLPRGIFLISNIWGPQSQLRKYTLFSYDYEQPGPIGSGWENDTASSGPTSWAPVGFNQFIVHPATSVPQTVLLDGIAYPVAENFFPYNGNELVPFQHEWFILLEEYCAVYARLKEGSAEHQESLVMYQDYLRGAKRMTEIQDRRDPLIFSSALGAPAGVNSIKRR